MKNCKTCKYFGLDSKHVYLERMSCGMLTERVDHLVFFVSGYEVEDVYVAPDFGCVLHEENENAGS